jgi:hypothetical protein
LHGRISSEDLLHTMTTINNNMLWTWKWMTVDF